jgi:uncharacterized membrane protein YbhN (UPF0104 family)
MKYIRILIALAITLSILIFLIIKVNPGQLLKIYNHSNKGLLILTSLILLLSPLITALRWKVVLNVLGLNAGFVEAARIYFANYPLSKITPSSSGDIVRAFYLGDRLSASKQLGGILAERLFDIATLAFFSLIGAIVTNLKPVVWLASSAILAIFIFFLIAPKIKISLKEKWNKRIEDFFYFFKILIKNPTAFALIAIYTLSIWLVIFIHIKLSFLAFNTSIPFFAIISIQPIVAFVSLLPFTLAGLGAREPAMIFLFSSFAPAATSLAVGLTYSFIGQILVSVFCLPLLYLAWKKIYKKPSPNALI